MILDKSELKLNVRAQQEDEMSLSDTDTLASGTTLVNSVVDSGWRRSGRKGDPAFTHVNDEGQIQVSLDIAREDLPDLSENAADAEEEFAIDSAHWRDVPQMNIVIMIVGSRGDVQPYVALGKKLKADGHRVRIGTHETFHNFVTDGGLEFYPIGGDPQELMSYMVKNPGLMPGIESLKNGDIGRKRKMLAEMINGCWLACHSPCLDTGRTFMADAIISNPPAFAHVHCAEALGIPLHMSFTMPWSPTRAFPHPLVNVKSSNAGLGITNYLSYSMSDVLTWKGTGDLINKFRRKSLGLDPLTVKSGSGLLDTLRVPWTYCMSSALVPKPKDWGTHIDVVGFYFLDLARDYTPPEDLVRFLADGTPPIYIGFGSVVVDDPYALTETLFKAAEAAGVRALISAGWGGLGGISVPSHIFILGNVPHDWLFSDGKVSAVVHHAGAGTTAAGLSKGLPTVTVPFFGDQKFWGDMIHRAGAGPAPISQKKLNVESLTSAIQYALSTPAQEAARRMAEQIQKENGIQEGVDSFYRHLPLRNMRCDLDPTRVAVWWSPAYCLKLSAFAAQVLAEEQILDIADLQHHYTKYYDAANSSSDPLIGHAFRGFRPSTRALARMNSAPSIGGADSVSSLASGSSTSLRQMIRDRESISKLYNSAVRPAGEVKGFTSGVSEAAKGFLYGFHDGITGLYKAPIEGAKNHGLAGAVAGAASGVINAAMKPAVGAVGLFSLPLEGIHLSVKSFFKRKIDLPSRRIEDGIEAVKESRENEKDVSFVVVRFDELKTTIKERRVEYEILRAERRRHWMWSRSSGVGSSTSTMPKAGPSNA